MDLLLTSRSKNFRISCTTSVGPARVPQPSDSNDYELPLLLSTCNVLVNDVISSWPNATTLQPLRHLGSQATAPNLPPYNPYVT